jgi:hypothetical protein
MNNARLGLAFRGKGKSETMFPPEAPFFSRTWGISRFPTPLHIHSPTEVGL